MTLVELLIVIAILGILATALYWGYTGYMERARDNVRKSNLHNISLAMTTYLNDNYRVPNPSSKDNETIAINNTSSTTSTTSSTSTTTIDNCNEGLKSNGGNELKIPTTLDIKNNIWCEGGVVGESVKNEMGTILKQLPKDPKTQTRYKYYTDSKRVFYFVLAELEIPQKTPKDNILNYTDNNDQERSVYYVTNYDTAYYNFVYGANVVNGSTGTSGGVGGGGGVGVSGINPGGINNSGDGSNNPGSCSIGKYGRINDGEIRNFYRAESCRSEELSFTCNNGVLENMLFSSDELFSDSFFAECKNPSPESCKTPTFSDFVYKTNNGNEYFFEKEDTDSINNGKITYKYSHGCGDDIGVSAGVYEVSCKDDSFMLIGNPTSGYTELANLTIPTNISCSKKIYTITFDLMGGEIADSNKTRNGLEHGSKIGNLPTPTKTNYNFDGWYSEQTGGEKIDENTIVNGNKTYYARWINSGSCTLDGATIVNGGTRNFYRFDEAYYIDGSPIGLFDCDSTYSQKELSCTDGVIYDSEDGSIVDSNTVFLFSSCEKKEYNKELCKQNSYFPDFTYTKNEGLNYFFQKEKNIPNGKILYKHELNCGSDAIMPAEFTVTCDETFTLNGERTGFITDGKIIKNHSPAICSKAQYTVTFNSMGGSTNSTRIIDAGSNIGTLPAPSKNGYEMDGWYTSETGGTKISGGTIVNSNVTYYARWISTLPTTRNCNPAVTNARTCTETLTDPNNGTYGNRNLVCVTGYTANTNKTACLQEYTITFNSLGGSTVANKKVAAGNIIGELPNSIKDGYELTGWYTSRNGEGTKLETTTTINSNITYYADWDCPAGTAIYRHSNGVTIKARECAKDGKEYEFEGENWYVARNNTNNVINKIKSGYPANRIVTTKLTIMNQLFKDNVDFNGDISNWDTSNVVYMQQTFEGARSFNQNINNWDVSNVRDMVVMFKGATNFNQPLDKWDVSNVRNMVAMFNGAKSFNQNINNWNVSNVNYPTWMFAGATSFNQPLDNWDTSNFKNMYMMFAGATSFNQPINNWNTGNVTNMEYVFNRATSFNQPLNNWNTGNVTTMRDMFSEATSFNQPLNNWNTGNVTNMYKMFYMATSFNQTLNNWNTGNVTDMRDMFIGATSFNEDISSWCVEKIKSKPSNFATYNNTSKQPKWGQPCN